jgi:hypothetical protein
MRLRIGQTNDVANDQRPSRNLNNRDDLQRRVPGQQSTAVPSVHGGRRSMQKYPSARRRVVLVGAQMDRSCALADPDLPARVAQDQRS